MTDESKQDNRGGDGNTDDVPERMELQLGLDYRACEMPADFAADPSGDEFSGYVAWLAAYLQRLELEPVGLQKALCERLAGMPADNAVALLGMEAGTYEGETIPLEVMAATREHFSEGFTEFEDEDVDWITQRAIEIWCLENPELIDQASHFTAKVGNCPDVRPEIVRQHLEEEGQLTALNIDRNMPSDTPWRIPLAAVLREAPDEADRIRLLTRFYDYLWDYAYR